MNSPSSVVFEADSVRKADTLAQSWQNLSKGPLRVPRLTAAVISMP